MSGDENNRAHYRYFSEMQTRWKDNDIYGHLNNVAYYSVFDSVANQYLIERGGLDIHHAEVVGFVVASQCQYLKPVSYPKRLEIGFRVNRLGNSSVEYRLAAFVEGETSAAAIGTFTHVFVDRRRQQSVPIPAPIRLALEQAQ